VVQIGFDSGGSLSARQPGTNEIMNGKNEVPHDAYGILVDSCHAPNGNNRPPGEGDV
jgi:hypothetical protein